MIYQSAARIMLVKPAVFTFNPETSVTNAFQLRVDLTPDQTYEAAMRELEAVYHMYVDNGVTVELFESRNPYTPDAIFPNCVSTFPGEVFKQKKPVAVLHPMNDRNRIAERSLRLIDFLRSLGYEINDELLKYEAAGKALEGTGSVVMDHVHKIAYCALSKRTHIDVAEAYADMIGYALVPFETKDHNGQPVYHTDLVMNINTGFSQVADVVIVEEDRARVLDSLEGTGRDVMKLDMRQFKAFCGNSLEVRAWPDKRLFSTSTKAFKALKPAQVEMIESHVEKIIHTKIRMIERVGGGSERCLTQELHGL